MGVVQVSGHPGSVMYGKPAASGRAQLAVGGESVVPLVWTLASVG